MTSVWTARTSVAPNAAAIAAARRATSPPKTLRFQAIQSSAPTIPVSAPSSV